MSAEDIREAEQGRIGAGDGHLADGEEPDMATMKEDAQVEQEYEEAKSQEWGCLNVRAFQVKGWAESESGERVKATMADPVCNPYRNRESGHEFYRVRMNDGAEFETNGEAHDISRHSMNVSANLVKPSERFAGSVGIRLPEDAELKFRRKERLEDGTWKVASEVRATLQEARAAQHASTEAYKRKQAQEPEKAPEAETPAPMQAKQVKEPHTVAGVAKQARAKAAAAKQGGQAQSQDAPKPKQQSR